MRDVGLEGREGPGYRQELAYVWGGQWAVKFYRGSRDDRVRGKVRVWVKQGSEPAVHT